MVPLSPVYFLFIAIICVIFWMCSSFRTLRLAVLLLANFLFAYSCEVDQCSGEKAISVPA